MGGRDFPHLSRPALRPTQPPVEWVNVKKDKGLPQQAEVSQGVPGRLRSRIFLTFGTTRVVGRQPYPPGTFTPGEISGSLEAESNPGHMVPSAATGKIPSD